MRQVTVAKNYAATLFELALRHGQHEAFGSALDELSELLHADARVRAFIETPKIDSSRKKAAIAAALGPRVPQLFLNFVNVVFDKRRERIIADIAREYTALLDQHMGRLHANVTLARRPTPDTERAITAELSRSLGKEVIPSIRVDENILGGIVVRYGDRVLDGSLRRRLLSLRNRLRNAGVPGAV